MTDTKDIKALRSEAANIIGLLTTEGHQSFTLDKAADFFDDVFLLLEAEPQLAEAAESYRNYYPSKCIELEAEIAAIKSKLANPVVLHNERYDYQDPDEYEQGYVRGYNASRLNSIADIEKAGFTVKGE